MRRIPLSTKEKNPEWYEENVKNYIEYKLTDKDIKRYIDFLSTIKIINYYNGTILDIIDEETSAFFANAVTAEQCAKYIQNRVTIYLQEQS